MSDDKEPRVEVEVGPVQDLDSKIDDLHGNSTCVPISLDGILIGAEVTHVMPAERAKEIWPGLRADENIPAGEYMGIQRTEYPVYFLGAERVHSWKSVRYLMQADFGKKGVMGMQVRQVIGRALGEREDGQTFSAYVDIPWTQPERYNWQSRARLRLDTFLYDSCKCEARGSEIKICETHQKVAYIWHDQDREEIARYEGTPADTPVPSHGSGPVSELQPMHHLYPWAKLDTGKNEWVCTICGFREPALANNSTFRNQFIKRHMDCGFANPDTILPPSVEDKVLRELGRRLEVEYQQTGNMALDTARAWILNQAGSIVIEEKPKVKELEP
jgi:hypothetical protein